MLFSRLWVCVLQLESKRADKLELHLFSVEFGDSCSRLYLTEIGNRIELKLLFLPAVCSVQRSASHFRQRDSTRPSHCRWTALTCLGWTDSAGLLLLLAWLQLMNSRSRWTRRNGGSLYVRWVDQIQSTSIKKYQ